MKAGYRVLIFCKLLFHCICVTLSEVNNDYGLTVPEITSTYGYPADTFKNIKTQDGYLLTLFRIPNGRNRTNGASCKKPILLMHGLGGSSKDLVQLDPEVALVYLLADRGYDIWLGNARGTSYSRKHVLLNAYVNQEYWNFSWHEIGVYDIPAMIDFIKKVTKQNQIFYIGHSQGTTASYVLASERSKYNADISLVVSLAPVAFVEHILYPLIVTISKFESVIYALLKLIGISHIPPLRMPKLTEAIAKLLCADLPLVDGRNNQLQDIKDYICSSLDGITANPINTRQLSHYAQNINSGGFNQYDFGVVKNLQIYGVKNPLSYNLSKITAPVALFCSIGDKLAQPKDVNKLCDTIPNCVYKYEIPFTNFRHNDFIQSKDAVSLIYEKVFLLLDEYNEKK